MTTYIEAFRDVFKNGIQRADRTGVGTRSIPGVQIRYDLAKGFPLITEKRTFWKGVVTEQQWMLRGDRTGNIDFMRNRGVHIWDEWANEYGNLGPVYGAQARQWEGPERAGIDQLQETIDQLILNPLSRRHVVTMWNPGELEEMRLPPCITQYQFYVADDRLSMIVTQRSADMFLGVPFDLAGYALLLSMVAKVTSLAPGWLIWNGGDCHIYDNHVDQAKMLLERPNDRPLPELILPEHNQIDLYISEPLSAFELVGYNPYPTIGAEVAV